MKIETVKRVIAVATFVIFAPLMAMNAEAYTIVQKPDLVNGNPCDIDSSGPECDQFEVIGLEAGDTFTVNWNYFYADEDAGDDTVDVTADITVVSIIGATMQVEVVMTNDSFTSNDETNSIAVFAMTTGSETLSGASFNNPGTYLTGISDNDVLAGTNFDVCVFDSNCAGGGPVGGGVPNGGTVETFVIDLLASDGTYETGATLDTFMIKYKGNNSSELPGLPVGDDEEDPPPEVPEPATLTLFGFGLVGLGIMRRRRAA